jgi:inner membrane protein
MDTISQAALGVFTTDTLCRKTLGPKNIAIGMAAGILPDLDVLLPQLVEISGGNFYLTYLATHRTWSHSLVTAPILALMLAMLFMKLRPFRRVKFLPIFIAAWLAVVTHILLDLCTSYGIELFWPLSRHRFALFWVPEIDMFFLPALVIILLLVMTLNFRKRNSKNLSWVGLVAFVAYIAFGAALHHVVWKRAVAARSGNGVASSATRFEVFPHLGSLLVWRAVEISDADLKISRFDFMQRKPSSTFEADNQARDMPAWLGDSPAYAVMRHATSSFLWVQRDSLAGNDQQFVLQDVRFALSPAEPGGLIAIAAERDGAGALHYNVKSWFLGEIFLGRRSYRQATAQLWQNIFGR